MAPPWRRSRPHRASPRSNTKHVGAGHLKALGALNGAAHAWLGVLPVVANAGVEQDRDEEEIEKMLALRACFRGIQSNLVQVGSTVCCSFPSVFKLD